MKPLIGITSYAEEASWGHWRLPAALIPLSYVRSVELAVGTGAGRNEVRKGGHAGDSRSAC